MLSTSQTPENLSPNTGDVSVELDALPVDVLWMRMVAEVEKHVDLEAMAEVCQVLQIGRRKAR